MSNLSYQIADLQRLIKATHNLSEEFVAAFNETDSREFQNFLNELTPNIIAAKMMLQDRLRAIQQQQPVQ